jgi:hypothetical protein
MTAPCPAPVWLNGWQQDVWTLDDEEYRALEQPQARMLYDELTPLSMCDVNGIDKMDYPMLHGWDVPTVGARP